jgi:hypothetical protein
MNEVLFQREFTSITSSEIVSLQAGRVYEFTLKGDGEVQHLIDEDESVDGNWRTFTDSSGSSQGFAARIPQSGRIRFKVNTGTVVYSFVRETT